MTIGMSASDPKAIAPGLHFVSTPIGAARDITLRALDVLAGADVLAAEDTRTLRHLMEIHGIALRDRPLLAYHDHNGEAVRPRIMGLLREGRSVAYASEAGTPLVADPGYQLSRAAIAEGFQVLAAPGASAVLYALTVSGLPTDRFLFAGFPPTTSSARQRFLSGVGGVQATLVFYESPKRVGKLLGDMVSVWGGARQTAVCRELTKRFEEVIRGPLGDLAMTFADRDLRGEVVVLVDRAAEAMVDEQTVGAALVRALATQSVKDATADVARATGMARRDVYQMALKIVGER
jgi:16S rRNA (cytidine1402-2'-O)-methyltransferase